MGFFKKKYLKASMTLEASVAIPVFIVAIMTVLSVIEIFRAYEDIGFSLYSSCREIALYSVVPDKLEDTVDIDGVPAELIDTVLYDGYAYFRLSNDYTAQNGSSVLVTEGGISAIGFLESKCDEDNEIMDLSFSYNAGPIYNFLDTENLLLVNRFRFHLWTGYNPTEKSNEDSERMVYVTEYGTVYHLSRSCTYLQLSIRSVDAADIDNLRNNSGACYEPCELCDPEAEGILYITDYGTAYHCSLTCSGLKRTVMEIPISEVGDRSVCSGCVQ